MSSSDLIQQQTEIVRREREQAIQREARERAEAIEAKQREAAERAEEAFTEAVNAHAAMRVECDRLTAAMLAAFDSPMVSYAGLSKAVDAATEAFERQYQHVQRAVARVMEGWQAPPSVWSGGTADVLAYQQAAAVKFNAFQNPISPNNALIAWVSRATDTYSKRWRVGLYCALYGQAVDAPKNFDAQAATDAQVNAVRNRRQM